ncbi:MAG TPA: TIGR03435 family protein [Terriglobia bacterium]
MAQQPPAKRAFELATVKPVDPNDSVFVTMSADPSMVSYRNLTLRDAIRGAYKVSDFQIVGPEWMSSVRFAVDAKLPAGATTDQIPEMFQTLLEERFKLTWRREPKEMQIYALLVGKDGPKLKPAQKIAPNQTMAMGTDGKPRAGVAFGGSLSAMTITAPSASLLTLTGVASRFTSRPVVDATGIDGDYDFILTFAAETDAGLPRGFEGNRGPSEPAPSFSEAVRKYGLRVEARKDTIDMFVITHLEKTPTEN